MAAEFSIRSVAIDTARIRARKEQSERKPPELIEPLFWPGGLPDHHQFLDHNRDRQLARHDDQAWRVRFFNEIGEVERHGTDIMGDQHGITVSRDGQDFRVFRSFGNEVLRQVKLNVRLPPPDTQYNVLIEIRVGQELDLHD